MSHSGTPRIGNGFDVHALVAGRRLVLGGVSVPFDRGLAGHSDADVLLHAICDAIHRLIFMYLSSLVASPPWWDTKWSGSVKPSHGMRSPPASPPPG